MYTLRIHRKDESRVLNENRSLLESIQSSASLRKGLQSSKSAFFSSVKLLFWRVLMALQIQPVRENMADLDHVFSDSDDLNDLQELANGRKTQKKEVKAYSDISGELMEIFAKLPAFKDPHPFKGNVCFIPENESNENLETSLKQLVETKDFGLFSSVSGVTPNIEAQLLILKSLTNEIEDKDFEGLDPRVASLYFWRLAEANTNDKVKCFYLVNSIIQYLKCTELAPMSLLFEQFQFGTMITEFCRTLGVVMRSSPFFESVMSKLSGYATNPEEVKAMISNANETGDANELSDLSDSFFEDLKAVAQGQAQPQPQPVLKVSQLELTNPLDLDPNETEVMSALPKPPVMVTYNLKKRNSMMMSADEFVDWMRAQMSTEKTFLYSSPQKGFPSCVLSAQVFNDILSRRMFVEDIRSEIPLEVDKGLQDSLMPLLHHVNCTTTQLFSSGVPGLKDHLDHVWKAHCQLQDGRSPEEEIAYFQRAEGDDLPCLDLKSIEKTRRIREIPRGEVTPITFRALALCEYSLLVESRCPFSLMPTPAPQAYSRWSQRTRAEQLFHLYVNGGLPPYALFRVAFTIAVLARDCAPEFATNILFEGLVILLQIFPFLKATKFVKTAFLALAEGLNSTGRYYYTAIAMDNASVLAEEDTNITMKIASIALKNFDIVRAIYHYANAIRIFATNNMKDEAIYAAQVLAKVYSDHDMRIEAVSVLMYVLKRYGKLTTMNVVTTAASLCDLLCKLHCFSKAEYVLNSIVIKNASMAKLVASMKAQIHFERNCLDGFVALIMEQANKQPKTAYANESTIRETILQPMRLIVKACILRDDLVTGLFWCEVASTFACQINVLRDIANVHRFRGIVLATLYRTSSSKMFYFSDIQLNDYARSFGSFGLNASLDRFSLLSEALSSLSVAINVFDRCGNTVRMLECRLLWLELIVIHFLTSYLGGIEPDPITIKKVNFLTDCAQKRASSHSALTLDETTITTVDPLISVCQSVDVLCRIYMHPIYIIRSQAISASVMLMRGQVDEATVLFENSVRNLRDIFFDNELHFLGHELKISLNLELSYVARLLSTILIGFGEQYISVNLGITEMMNEIEACCMNRRRLVVPENEDDLDETIGLDMESLARLAQPQFPVFPFASKTKTERKLDYETLLALSFDRLKSNILSEMQETQMTNANKKIIRQIMGVNKHPEELTNEPPNNSIYVMKLYDLFAVVIPCELRVRVVPAFKCANDGPFVQGIVKLLETQQVKNPLPPAFFQSTAKFGRDLFGKQKAFKKYAVEVVPDDNDFREKKGFSGQRGRLYTVSVPKEPLLIITDYLISALPFELFFPKCPVIRAFSSRARKNTRHTLRPTIVRYTNYEAGDNRITTLVDTITNEKPLPITVNEMERAAPLPFPLFSQQRDTLRYAIEYPYFDIIPFRPENVDEICELKNSLFIFTYADLVEMPLSVKKLIDNNVTSCFMFIPAGQICSAMIELEQIYDRHYRRKAFFQRHPNSKSKRVVSRIMKHTYDFVAALQLTLMEHLKVPVAVITPV